MDGAIGGVVILLLLEEGDRRMQQFVDDRRGQGFDGAPLLVAEILQGGAKGFLDFGAADLFETVAQGDNRRHDIEGRDPAGKGGNLFLDNPFRLLRLFVPLLEVGGDDALQVVDIVKIDVGDIVDAGIDVAGDGDIDKEHRLVLALLDHLFDLFRAEDKGRGAGRGEDDIDLVEMIGEIVKGNRPPLELFGELDRPLEGAVGDVDLRHRRY